MASAQSRPKERNYGLQSLGSYAFMENLIWQFDSPRHIDSVYKTQKSVKVSATTFVFGNESGLRWVGRRPLAKMMERVHRPLTSRSSTLHTRGFLGTFHRRRFHLMKTGFFRKVIELKIQRKKSRQCFMGRQSCDCQCSFRFGGLLDETITCLAVDGHSLDVKLTTVCCCCWCEGI